MKSCKTQFISAWWQRMRKSFPFQKSSWWMMPAKKLLPQETFFCQNWILESTCASSWQQLKAIQKRGGYPFHLAIISTWQKMLIKNLLLLCVESQFVKVIAGKIHLSSNNYLFGLAVMKKGLWKGHTMEHCVLSFWKISSCQGKGKMPILFTGP